METTRRRRNVKFLGFTLAVFIIPMILYLPIFHHEFPPTHNNDPNQDRVGNRRVRTNADIPMEEDVRRIPHAHLHTFRIDSMRTIGSRDHTFLFSKACQIPFIHKFECC
jgi:hypothetical protein